MAALEQVLWEESFANKRSRLMTENCQASLQVQSLEDLNRFISDSLEPFVKDSCIRSLARFAASLKGLVSFFNAVKVASQSAEGPLLIWSWTHALICICNKEKGLNSALDVLTQYIEGLPVFDHSQNSYLEAHSHYILRDTFNAYCAFCIELLQYLRPWKASWWGLWYYLSRPAPNRSLLQKKEILRESRELLALRKQNEIERLTSAMTAATAPSNSSGSILSAEVHISTIRPAENYNFSGREKVLEDLHHVLRGRADTNLEPGPTCCVIHGIGGIGKTQTALQYTYDERYTKFYDAIFWLRAETLVDLLRTFAMIGEKLAATLTPNTSRENSQERESTKEVHMAQEWLENTTSRWLLIFDNVEKAQDIRDYIPKKASCGAIIITTQLPNLAKVTRNPIKMALPSLEPSEGAELLLKSFDKSLSEATEEDRRTAQKISEFVGGLPLALTTSGGYMSQSILSLDQFFTSLGQSDAVWAEASSPGAVDAGDYDKTLATVFDLALSRLSSGAKSLLNILAFFNADLIPEEMLLAQHRDKSLQDLLREDNYRSLIKDLNSRQLIKKESPQGGRPYLSIHRTLQLSILHRLGRDHTLRKQSFYHAFGLVQEQLPERSLIQVSQPDEWHRYELYVPQVINLRRHSLWPAPELPLPMEFAQVLVDIGTYMWHSGFNDDGKKVLETAEKIVIDHEGEDHVLISDIDDIVGIIDDMIGVSCRTDSFRRRRRALRIRKIEHSSIPEPKRTRINKIRLYNAEANLACAHLQNEDWDAAGAIMEECLKNYQTWTDIHENIPFEYAKYYNHMAFVFMARGQPLEAIKMSRHACNLQELHNKGPNAPLVHWYRANLGNHLFHSGNVEESLRINQDCLRDRIRLGTEHSTWSLESHSTVGELLLRLGRPAEAKVHFEKIFEICEKMTWTEEGLAMAHFRFSRALAELGEAEKAEYHSAKATAIKDRFLEQYPQYLSRTITDEGVYNCMIPIWAGRFTGGLVQRS